MFSHMYIWVVPGRGLPSLFEVLTQALLAYLGPVPPHSGVTTGGSASQEAERVAYISPESNRSSTASPRSLFTCIFSLLIDCGSKEINC